MHNIYRSFLIGHLLYPPVSRTYERSEEILEMIEKGSLRLVLPHTGYLQTLEITSERPSTEFLRRLKVALSIHPPQYERNSEHILHLLLNGTHVYMDTDYRSMYMRRQYCDLTIIPADG